MPTLQELTAQKQALDAQIAEVAKAERKEAIATIRSLMVLHNIPEIKLEDEVETKVKKATVKVAPKWKNPLVDDQTWTGRGRTPLWFNKDTAIAL